MSAFRVVLLAHEGAINLLGLLLKFSEIHLVDLTRYGIVRAYSVSRLGTALRKH